MQRRDKIETVSGVQYAPFHLAQRPADTFVIFGLLADGKVPVERIVGRVREITENDEAIWETVNSPFSDLVTLSSLVLRPMGVGTVINNVVQDDYRLIAFRLDAK